jgi:glycerol-3-phosphate acyltransferase PlsY
MNHFNSILIIILAYLLGSIPFGYIFSKISGKEILKIGWQKTSGSNVFRYVGFWQGLATGLADLAKGFFAIFLAQNFNFEPKIQALCGAAAIVGHNWSFLLKFAGGRGIGTFIGAFLAFSPKLLGFSLVPFLLLSLIWNASIGTILFLIVSFSLAIYFEQFPTIGILTLASLPPIFLKRLSPIKELSWQKKELIRNRLVFDNDKLCLDLRIMRLFRRLTWW